MLNRSTGELNQVEGKGVLKTLMRQYSACEDYYLRVYDQLYHLTGAKEICCTTKPASTTQIECQIISQGASGNHILTSSRLAACAWLCKVRGCALEINRVRVQTSLVLNTYETTWSCLLLFLSPMVRRPRKAAHLVLLQCPGARKAKRTPSSPKDLYKVLERENSFGCWKSGRDYAHAKRLSSRYCFFIQSETELCRKS